MTIRTINSENPKVREALDRCFFKAFGIEGQCGIQKDLESSPSAVISWRLEMLSVSTEQLDALAEGIIDFLGVDNIRSLKTNIHLKQRPSVSVVVKLKIR